MPDVIESNKMYVGVGASVIIANLFVLITFCSTAKLFAKYQLLIVLAVADLVSGCGTLAAGYGRLIIYGQNPVRNDTTVADCLKVPWIPLMTIGGQWPAVIILMIGVERLLAVFKPMFYRTKYSKKHRAFAIFVTAAFLLGALVCAYLDRFIRGGMNGIVIPACTTSQTFAPIFYHFNRAVIIFGNLGGFWFSVIAALSARRQAKTAGAQGNRMRKEAQRSNILIAVTGFSVLLATLPQLAFWLSTLGLFAFPGNNADYITSIVFYMSSLVNFFIYPFFKEEYRARCVYLLTAGRCSKSSQVSTVHVLAQRQ